MVVAGFFYLTKFMSTKALSDYTLYARYASFVEEESRRETWEETCNRVFDMHERKYAKELEASEELRGYFEEAKQGLINKEILGSQRALQFGGRPIERKHAKLFNCSFGHICYDRVFNEIMHLLLCGCGVGFSVQKHHIKQLSDIQPKSEDATTEIFQPEDSIEGWADAVAALMSSYFSKPLEGFEKYQGKLVEFDFSLIRPEGSLIDGGFKAPGPNGLKRSLEKIDELLKSRTTSDEFTTGEFANKMQPIEAYDIVMHLSDAVLSGGVRRSATICLFSLDDMDMMNAKTGNWFKDNPQRGRSNNSAVFVRGKSSKKEFEEVKARVKEFGEPAFVFLNDEESGVNPCCVSGETKVLTDKGYIKAKDLSDKPFNAVVDGKIEPSSDKGFWVSGEKDIYTLSTREGFSVEVTKDHRIKTSDGWVPAEDLVVGQRIIVGDNMDHNWEGVGNNDQGWLVGSLLGDGTFTEDMALLDYWGSESEYLPELAVKLLNEQGLVRKNTKPWSQSDTEGGIKKKRVGSAGLKVFAESVGIGRDKCITDNILHTSSNFVCGFLSGWFDADGSVQGNSKKGHSIRLSSCNKNNLQTAQQLLNAVGVFSKLRKSLDAGYRELPDGKGGRKPFWCKSNYELIISREDMVRFGQVIGFRNIDKKEKLENIIKGYTRPPYKTNRTCQFVGLEYKGKEVVYDCNIPTVESFDAQGIIAHNCEIVFRPVTEDGKHGFQMCNLSTINGKLANTREKFVAAARAASIIGTIQAGYTEFGYLGKETRELTEKEALLGVSITGVMDSPDITLDPEIQRAGAEEVKRINAVVADLLGINPAARLTCVKPEGSASCILGTSSGIHPHHAKRYFRRVQANRMEFPVQYFQMYNPKAVTESAWSANKTDQVITFLCEVPKGSIIKNQLDAIGLLDNVKLTQQNWVETGTVPERCNKPYLRHNVSNTISVGDDEWDDVFEYLWENQNYFTGVSMISKDGDKDYPQAPFCTVYTANEIVKEYGDASIFASGLITAGLKAFDDNLWSACSHALGIESVDGLLAQSEKACLSFEASEEAIEIAKVTLSDAIEAMRIADDPEEAYGEIEKTREKIEKLEEIYNILDEECDTLSDTVYRRTDWIRRAQQFADRYFEGNTKKMTYCLKDVHNWKEWKDLQREYVDVDWSLAHEEKATDVEIDTLGAIACAGGACALEI